MAGELVETLGYWGPAFTFLGGLLGAAMGGPGLEWIKDHIGESRRWKIQKAEIVANVRMTLGLIDAFEQLKTSALGSAPTQLGARYPEAYHDYSPSAFAGMRGFDPSVILDAANKLSALHPKDSIRSAAGQRLVQYIYVLVSQINDVKNIIPLSIDNSKNYKFIISEDDGKLLKRFDAEMVNFKRFISAIYASKFSIDALNIIYDPEIKSIEHELLRWDLERSQEQYAKALAQYSWNAKQERTTTPSASMQKGPDDATDQT